MSCFHRRNRIRQECAGHLAPHTINNSCKPCYGVSLLMKKSLDPALVSDRPPKSSIFWNMPVRRQRLMWSYFSHEPADSDVMYPEKSYNFSCIEDIPKQRSKYIFVCLPCGYDLPCMSEWFTTFINDNYFPPVFRNSH